MGRYKGPVALIKVRGIEGHIEAGLMTAEIKLNFKHAVTKRPQNTVAQEIGLFLFPIRFQGECPGLWGVWFHEDLFRNYVPFIM